MHPEPIPASFIRYLRLYTLHTIEQTSTHQRFLQVRLATYHYIFTHLPSGLDKTWQIEPNQGVHEASQWILPRLETLLNEQSTWEAVLETSPHWQPYLALRQTQSFPSVPQFYSLPSPQNKLAHRLGQAEQWLRATQTALELVNTGLVLWQNWQKLRNERLLLQDAIQANLASQYQALQHSLAPGFVPKYLNAHGDDPVYPFLFDQDPS